MGRHDILWWQLFGSFLYLINKKLLAQGDDEDAKGMSTPS